MDIDEIRRINIKALEAIHGAAKLYKAAGMSPTQYYNLRNGAKDSKTGKPRGMRIQTAQRFEDAANVPRGYLDKLHSHENTAAAPQLVQQPMNTRNASEWPFVSVSPEEWKTIPQHKRLFLEEQIRAMVPTRIQQHRCSLKNGTILRIVK